MTISKGWFSGYATDSCLYTFHLDTESDYRCRATVRPVSRTVTSLKWADYAVTIWHWLLFRPRINTLQSDLMIPPTLQIIRIPLDGCQITIPSASPIPYGSTRRY